MFFPLIFFLNYYHYTGDKWAKNLYDVISTRDAIQDMAIAEIITKGDSPFHKYVMLLFSLAPDTDYVEEIHTDILTYQLQELNEYFEGTEPEIVDEQIRDITNVFLSKLNSGKSPFDI